MLFYKILIGKKQIFRQVIHVKPFPARTFVFFHNLRRAGKPGAKKMQRNVMLPGLGIKIIGNAPQTQIVFANVKICFFFDFPNSRLFIRFAKFKMPSGRAPAPKPVNAFSLPQKNLAFLIKNINSNPDANNIFHCFSPHNISLLERHYNIQN